jgi:hypothetical protein
MSQLRSKQIFDFNSSITWSGATSSEIPNSYDIKQQFLAKDQMAVEEFTNQTIASSTSQWTLTLSQAVLNDEEDFVSVYVNSLKTDGVLSVSTTGGQSTITIDAYDYNIDSTDVIKVHYIIAY